MSLKSANTFVNNVGVAVQTNWNNIQPNRAFNLNVRRMFEFLSQYGPCWDLSIASAIEATHLEDVFVIECPNVKKSLYIVLGEEFLQNKSGSTHCTNIVSKFLTNCMDLLEDRETIKQLANVYVQHYFKPQEDFDPYIDAYVIEMRNDLIGGLFSLESLSSCAVTTCVYNSLKIVIYSQYEVVVDHTLNVHCFDFS